MGAKAGPKPPSGPEPAKAPGEAVNSAHIRSVRCSVQLVVRNLRVCVLVVATLLASCGRVGPTGVSQQTASGARSVTPSPASSARLESSPAPSPTPPKTSPDPLLLSNTTGSFAFRHPASWSFTNCENYGYAIGFSASEGACPGESSGFFDMLVMSVQGDQRSAPTQRNYVWIGSIDHQAATQVDGVDGTRISAHVDKDPGMGPEAGTTQIMYDVYNGTRTYLVLYQHRPNQADYSTAFDDVMQHSFRFSPWNGYHGDLWSYTLDYPASWYDLSTPGGPDTEKYFGNERDIASPIGMDSAGAFFALSVASSCRAAPSGNVDNTAQLTVNGQTVTRVSGFLGPPQSEVFWSSYASVPSDSNCFGFAFIFGSKSARDSNLRMSDEIISSFTTL